MRIPLLVYFFPNPFGISITASGAVSPTLGRGSQPNKVGSFFSGAVSQVVLCSWQKFVRLGGTCFFKFLNKNLKKQVPPKKKVSSQGQRI
jgi:hypothetical protein